MLIGVDPPLGPECLAALRAMGHGDTLLLADANFPAHAGAGRVVRLDGVGVAHVLRVVLSLLPIDDFEPDPLVGMQVVGDAAARPAIVDAMQAVVDEVSAARPRIALVERFAFYARARPAFAVFATGERALYGNLLLRNGVLPPPAAAAPAGGGGGSARC